MASASLITVISGCTKVYQPAPHPTARHILLAGGKIQGFPDDAQAAALAATGLTTTLDASGLVAVPGFVDMHVHITGGGGEAGPASRTPEAQLSELLNAGITTVVGILGTDCVSRSQENLVTKARALQEDGITCLHWCGSYRLPPATITGSVQRELCLIEGCIGVGELAVSDHRGSVPTPHQLAQLASEARVGGMLSGKAGLVHCHMGPGSARLAPLREALACSRGDIPITQFLPTHMDRSAELAAEGEQWLLDGGRLDFTCGSRACREALDGYFQKGLPLERCSVSTDAYGSLPKFDKQGRLVAYNVASPGTLLDFMRAMVFHLYSWPLERVLPLMTSSPAAALRLPAKGQLAPGCDADLLLLDAASLELRYVLARGEVVRTPDWVRGSYFEKGPGIRPRRPAGQ